MMQEAGTPAADAPRPRRRFDFFWLFILLVPPWLIFPNLGAGILWQDEAETATLARCIVKHGYPLADDGTPPLDKAGHSLWAITDQRPLPDGGFVDINKGGVWIWTSWFGNYLTAGSLLVFDALGQTDTMEQQTLAARFPFALGAWLTLAVMYVALTDMCGDRRTSRVAVILLALCVPYILFARQCRSYPYLSLFTLLQTWGYVRMTRGRRYGAALFTLGGVGGFYTFFPTMMGATGALGVHALLTHGPRIPRGVSLREAASRLRGCVWFHYLVGCAIIAALTLPFFVYTRSWDRNYDNSGVPISESWSRLAASLRAYLVHVHTSAFPFVLVVPAAWASCGWVRRRALAWGAGAFGAATAGVIAYLSLTVGRERGLHMPDDLESLRTVASTILEYTSLSGLAALFLTVFLFLMCLLALPGAAAQTEAKPGFRALRVVAMLIAVAGLYVVMVMPATVYSLAALLGYALWVGIGLFLWAARSGWRATRGDRWFETNWKQAAAFSTAAVIFSAAALANHPFYRYLMGALPLLALATAACVMRMTRRRLIPAIPILLLLVGCELFQFGPLYAARKLVLDPWRRERIAVLSEEHRKAGHERPVDKAYDDSYHEATAFGHKNTNGYTWTMLAKNGRLNKWLEYQELEFPLYNLYLELRDDYEGPIEEVIRYLNEHADKNDLVTTVYENFPLRYYTDLLVLRTRDLTTRFGNKLPDWIVFQHWDYDLGLPKFVYDRAKDPNYYERIKLPVGASALPWDNIPEPAWHHFRTVSHDEMKKPVFLRLKPEAKARTNAQASTGRTSVETLP
ncbi:MAG: hypothetical protein IT449_01640 [Phycisphaerales bacterium]|nr:hypothetical protein [Phycisphaerales bacterium]